MKRSQASAKRIRNLIVVSGLIAIIFSTSTYAWFIGMRTVNVPNFDVEVAVTDSLLLSLNGEQWGGTISFDNTTLDQQSYLTNTNGWGGKGLAPISTVGDMDTGASRMIMFEKASLTTTPGGYRLLASRVNNYEEFNQNEPDGYMVFDLFIKNYSGTQYIEDLNILDEEAIYLTVDSAVTVAEGGVANTGIENSVRVAFTQIGRVKGTITDAAKITGINCAPDEASGVTGICRKAQIWEPNDIDHTINATNWYNTSCMARTGEDVTDEDSYSGTCGAVTNGTAYPTYAVSTDIESADNIDIYDGTAYNKYSSSNELVAYDYFTDTDKLLVSTERPSFMMLAPNSITKLRIYVYIEGQDVDNYDFASIGKMISIKFGFTKERYAEGDIKPVLPIDSCFLFNSSTGVINDYYTYEDNNSNNSECPKSIIIPTTINGAAVTSIGNDAFRSNGLEKVRIQNNITSIGSSAFENNDLISVKLSDGLTTIGYAAFQNNDLTSVIIPNTVTSMGDFAFYNNQLSSLTLSNSLGSIPAVAFKNNKLTGVTIPSSVTSIGSSAFYNNLLTNVTIPNSVTIIDNNAFYGNKLTDVVFPETSLLTIKQFAFYNNLLTDITIPNSVTAIGISAFENNNLTSATLSNSITKIESNLFAGNDLESIVIPNLVTTIGSYAFYNNNLASATLSTKTTTIGDYAFYSNELTSITIPNTVTSIGFWTFRDNNISGLTLPMTLSNINVGAFAQNNLTSIILPTSLIMISNESFSQNLISSVTFSNSLITIGDDAFANNQLTSVTFPNNLRTIRSGAFYGNSLTTVTIPSLVTYLGTSAFNVNALTSVCIKGKASSAGFTTYGTTIWGWAPYHSASDIIWNCTN